MEQLFEAFKGWSTDEKHTFIFHSILHLAKELGLEIEHIGAPFVEAAVTGEIDSLPLPTKVKAPVEALAKKGLDAAGKELEKLADGK